MTKNGVLGPSLLLSVLHAGDSDRCLKVHVHQQSFQSETSVLLDPPAHVKRFLPDLRVESKEHLAVSMPFCQNTLASAKFSERLFVSVCRGAGAVLPWLHEEKQLAYRDPSPHNVLIYGDDVAVWNDFADVAPLHESLVALSCTPAYASNRLLPLFCAQAAGQKPGRYEAIDDAQAVFFTLLSFVWDSGSHVVDVPWRHDDIQQMCLLKAQFVHSWLSGGEDLSVQPVTKKTMDSLFDAIFREQDAKTAWKVLSEVTSSSREGPVELERVRDATKLFHAVQSRCTKNTGPVVSPCASHKLPCTSCFPFGVQCVCSSCSNGGALR
jgi:hypothetical protein